MNDNNIKCVYILNKRINNYEMHTVHYSKNGFKSAQGNGFGIFIHKEIEHTCKKKGKKNIVNCSLKSIFH